MKEITAKEVEQRLKGGHRLHIIDVREIEEVAAGAIPGALNIPLGLLEFRMNELSKDREYVIVCRSGGRSAKAVQLLERYGYKAANMTGGMLAWEGPVKQWEESR
ncbi:rhodanese-like domain-containing protein [Anoxybacteroides rupiense]|uniref:rhodanese-like domain-containing protein n=1 Tax=Anoxybacteroides rupiense TaxID=311460 RepID=UPI001F0948C0|nr:rhodanese-like domain-containing protein [Anoxybacillus rupiensis]